MNNEPTIAREQAELRPSDANNYTWHYRTADVPSILTIVLLVVGCFGVAVAWFMLRRWRRGVSVVPLPGDPAATLWFYQDGENVVGPLACETLMDLAAQGIVQADSPVRAVDDDAWTPAGQWRFLAGHVQRTIP